MKSTITETIELDGICGEKLVDAIATLQAALASLPEEYRSEAIIDMDAYDCGGMWVEYERGMNAEELAKSEALLADRAALIAATSPGDMAAWVRGVRMRHAASAGSMDRRHMTNEEALAFIRTNNGSITEHPKFDWRTNTILL